VTDLLCVVLSVLWFAMTAGFIALCERLMPPDRGSKP